MRPRLVSAALVALLGAAVGGSAAVSDDALGLPIGEVSFEGAPVDHDALAGELPVRSGEPLTAAAVEESVEWLRRKEIFAEVEALSAVRGGRVEVRFRLTPLPFVSSVVVRGEHEIDETTLARRARIREDEPLSPERLAGAEERLREFYRARGFPDVELRIEAREEAPGEARVTIRIENEGDPIRIDAVTISGLPTDLEEGARNALPFGLSDVYTDERLRSGKTALVRFLRDRRYYEAEVAGAESVEGKRATLRYSVEPRVPFEVEAHGNQALASDTLLGLTDLASRPIITEGTWRLVAERIRERYREEGYPFAEATASVEEGMPARVRIEVREGPKVEVRSIRFQGNQTIDDGELLGLMETRPKGRLPLPGARPFREDVLVDDLDRIRGRYRELGYLEMEVADVRHDFPEDPGKLDLTIDITEGAPTFVAAVEVAGADGILADPLANLALQAGRPFRPEAAEADAERLAARLAAEGYPDARVSVETEDRSAGGGRKAVLVRHRASPGQRVTIGRVVVQGNYYTKDGVVLRALPFRRGDPLDRAKLTEAQSEIYRLGLFRSVSIEPLQASGSERDVGVRVGERPGGEVQYGFGYNTRAGVRNLFQISHKNIAGSGRQASLRTELNLSPRNLAPDEYVFTLDGKNPHLLASRYDLRGTAIYQRSERAIDEFSIRRFSFSSGFERQFSRRLQASLMLEYEDSNVFNVAPDAVLTGQDVGKLRTVSLNPILIYDGRDDAFAPTRGVFDTLRFRYGARALGSDVHFAKLVVQHSHTVPLGSDWTWIYAGRVGFAQPLGGSTTIPLRERFFLGGRTSVRGYDENSIGPRGVRGNPIGGDLLLVANTELRFPLLYGLRGAVFVDAGGLYLHERAISLGEVREGVGPGLRYQTPVGSISLDYGFKVRRRAGESIGEVHFTIGNLF